MSADASSPLLPRPSRRRTWPERLSIAFTFLAALVCLAVAAALVISYTVVRNRNVADFQNPAQLATADGPAEETPGLALGPAAPILLVDTAPAAPTPTPAAADPTTEAGGADPTTEAGGAGPTTDAGAPSDSPSPAGADAPPAAASPDESTGSLDEPVTAATAGTATTPAPAPAAVTRPTTVNPPRPTAPPATFPDPDPEARNFLITGADNGACVDPDSPMAAGFGDRESMGERSDTIMIVRLDPEADRVAVLSFPRDLWVEIAGTGNMQRINSAYDPGEPQQLADTIYENFGIPIDHYIQVDFCAFKTLVDSVGGVAVPFEYPAMDRNTGLLVETTGCVNLDGDMALAYVRSRHYRYEDPPGSGNWESDPTSDLGRISRQQDFLRRVLSTLLDKGPLNPSVARGLIRAGTDYIVTDRALTPARMMEFAGVMNDVDPASITTYQIEASGRNINGNAVLIPNTDGENMQAVLALFRGDISLADAPVQQFEQTTTAPPRGTTTTVAPDGSVAGGSTEAGTGGPGSTDAAPLDSTTETTETTEPAALDTAAEATVTSAPPGGPAENQFGVVPPRDVEC